MRVLKPTLLTIILTLILTFSYTPFIKELISCPEVPSVMPSTGNLPSANNYSCTYRYILPLQFVFERGQQPTQFAVDDSSNRPSVSYLLIWGIVFWYIVACVIINVGKKRFRDNKRK